MRVVAPQELIDALDSASEEHEIKGKSKSTFYGVLLGMAISHYEYDPDFRPKQHVENEPLKRIHKDLQSAGVNISIDTLGRWMREAHDWAEGPQGEALIKEARKRRREAIGNV